MGGDRYALFLYSLIISKDVKKTPVFSECVFSDTSVQPLCGQLQPSGKDFEAVVETTQLVAVLREWTASYTYIFYQ